MEAPVEHPTPACAQLDGVVPGAQQVSKNLSHKFIQLAISQLLHRRCTRGVRAAMPPPTPNFVLALKVGMVMNLMIAS